MEDETAGYQMKLAFRLSESELKNLLERGLNRKISLVLTSNSSSMLTSQVKEGILHIRLHEMFLSAGPDIIDEIIAFISDRRRRIPLFRSFIRENSCVIQHKPSRKVNIRTSGRHHDLLELFNEVNRGYFRDTVTSRITWGCGKTGVWVRKRTLGSYSAEANLIRINPVLDSAKVPRYYLKYIVFHEMLHADMGTAKKGGRRCIHSAEFKRRERMFMDYERAIAWERK